MITYQFFLYSFQVCDIDERGASAGILSPTQFLLSLSPSPHRFQQAGPLFPHLPEETLPVL